MKRGTLIGILIFTLVAILLSGCQPAMEDNMKKDNLMENDVIEDSSMENEVIKDDFDFPEEEIIKEDETLIEGIPDDFIGDLEEEAEEIPEEVPEEEPKEPVMTGKVTKLLKINEPFNYNGKIFTMTKYYDSTFIEFNVDGIRSRFTETRKSEIVNGLRATYERSWYSKNNTIEVSLEEFKLGQNEYLMNKKDTLEIKNHTLRLDNIKFDSRINDGVAWFSYSGEGVDSLYIQPGQTKKYDDVDITLIEPFYRSSQYYAHIKLE